MFLALHTSVQRMNFWISHYLLVMFWVHKGSSRVLVLIALELLSFLTTMSFYREDCMQDTLPWIWLYFCNKHKKEAETSEVIFVSLGLLAMELKCWGGSGIVWSLSVLPHSLISFFLLLVKYEELLFTIWDHSVWHKPSFFPSPWIGDKLQLSPAEVPGRSPHGSISVAPPINPGTTGMGNLWPPGYCCSWFSYR